MRGQPQVVVGSHEDEGAASEGDHRPRRRFRQSESAEQVSGVELGEVLFKHGLWLAGMVAAVRYTVLAGAVNEPSASKGGTRIDKRFSNLV